MISKIFCLGVVFIFVMLSFSGCVDEDSNFIYVDKGGDGDFLTIQEALDHCSDGDTIVVREGVYDELIVIDKSVVIMGTNTANTILTNINQTSGVLVRINADSCTFKGITIDGPGYTTDMNGIEINSSNNVISSNMIKDTKNGIDLGDGSNNTRIYGNIIKNNAYGISANRAYDNNISNNEISSNEYYGIYLHLSNSYIISKNDVSDSNTGIRIKGSDNSLVFDNFISDCNGGLYCCCGSGGNKIYNNNFENNEDYSGRDDIYNQWDDGKSGNYWDDYIIINHDASSTNGIWDMPYNITSPYSNESKVDRFPLVNPIK